MRYLISIALVFCLASVSAQNKSRSTNRTLIVFFDGLRPDYITPELMPNLHAFREAGAYGKAHHSVFPTVTRVNASSYSTGAYPEHHGLMGNTVYFPQVDPVKGLNTGNAEEMQKVMRATDGHLLTALTLGEVLQQHGHKMMVFSSGSTGQALMQNHTVSGGATINPGMILPAAMQQQVQADLGAIPAHAKPNKEQHRWVTDALIRYGFAEDGPLVSAIWFSDPDGAAHSDGIGSPSAVSSIRMVDEEFGRILKALDDKGLRARTNVLISTDHGFSTHRGSESLTDLLIRKGLKKDKTSTDIVVSEGALYVEGKDPQKIRAVVSALQAEPWVGALFTSAKRKGELAGWVEGTLSFEAVHWAHPERAADILVDVNWSDEKNALGYAGTTYSRGVAGHGSLSPYDVHIPLIVSGPDFRAALESAMPTSNVDLVPTILKLYGLPIPGTMQGRVLQELLREGKKEPGTPRTEVFTVRAPGYQQTIQRTVYNNYTYVDFVKTERPN